MKYNCLIADDNILERDLVALYLDKIDGFNLVAACESGIEAAAVLANERVDVVFSDIDMPDLSGISLLKGLLQPPVFVFITSYTEYAVESFALDVVDFIVKPVTFERFYRAANKAAEYVELKKLLREKQLEEAFREQRPPDVTSDGDDHFFIRQVHGVTRLRYADVQYIESMGDFSKIYTRCGGEWITLVNLKNLTAGLPEKIFKRIHRQFTVNLNHIVNITSSSVTLTNEITLPVRGNIRRELFTAVVNKEVIGRNSK